MWCWVRERKETINIFFNNLPDFSDFRHGVNCTVTGRLNENFIGVPESYSKAAAEASLPSYCALNDPHLREYYQRKFSQPYLTASVSSIRGKKVRDQAWVMFEKLYDWPLMVFCSICLVLGLDCLT